MADEDRPESAADLVDARAEEHGVRLGLSEISYSHLTAAAVAHATRAPVAADPTWATIGPRNVGGRITAVGQHEDNPLVIYAGSAHGGLWVSRDAGDTWAHVGRPQHNFAVGTMAVPPGTAGEVIIGTGSMTGRYVSGLGLFKVTVPANPEDAVFTRLAGPPAVGSSPGDALAGAALRYTRIRLDPDNPARFWAASQTGLWRYEPRKATGFVRDFPVAANDPKGAPAFATDLQFLSVWPDYCTDVLVARDPRERARVEEDGRERARYLVIYVGVSEAGVFRGRFDRDDATVEWSPVLDVPNDDLYTAGRRFRRVRMALCESRPSVVYVVFASNPGVDPASLAAGTRYNLPEHNHASFVFRSDDSGEHWEKRGRIPRAHHLEDPPLPPPRDGQADYDLMLEVSPGAPDIVVCGEMDVCKSGDGGKTWSTILDWENYDRGDYSQHADQHIAMFDRADHRRLWVGNDGGLSLARDLRRPPGEPRYWRKRSHGIIAGQFQDVTVHPSPSFNFFCGGGLQDNGTFASLGGPTWMHIGWADGGAMAFHATIPDYFFVGQNGGANIIGLQATPLARPAVGLTNPILGDLPLADRRTFARLASLQIPGSGPFVAVLEQDPTVAGQCLVGWTASATNAIAYIVPPPPGPPLAPGSLPLGLPLAGLTGAGPVVVAGEAAQAVALGPVIAGPPPRVEGWIGTSSGQVLFSANASLPTGWGPAPGQLPVLGNVGRLVTRISVHPTDSWVVAAATVPDVVNLPATASAALQHPITVRIDVGGAVGAASFKFTIGGGTESAVSTKTAPSVSVPGTLTTLFFTPGAFVAPDHWTVGPDGVVSAAPGNTSAGGLAATVTPGGRVFLTYDRGATWTDVSAPSAPLPRPNPDLNAISPGPLGALEWDRSAPNATRLFAGTLAGVYVLPNIPASTGVKLTAKPTKIAPGTTIQLQAELSLTAGGPVKCTMAAEWSSSSPAVLAVSASGLVSIAPGAVPGNSSTITVRRGKHPVDTVTITIDPAGVAAAAPPAPFPSPTVAVAWRPFGKSLPLTLINDLTMVPNTSRLRAATFGRGVWDIDLAGDTNHRLYIRQTVIEDGHAATRTVPNVIGPLVAPLMDPRLPQSGPTRFAIDFTHAYDIRVDAAPQDFFDDVVDGVEFDEQVGVDEAVPFEDNDVYVQVHSSGVAVTDTVHVFLFARPSPVPAPHTAAPVPVPALGNVSDVYPPDAADKPVAPWVRIGAAPTVIRKVAQAEPVVARFTWTPNDVFADTDVALLALCTTPKAADPAKEIDPLPAAPVDATSFTAFITKERRAALRIVHVAKRPAASFYVRDGIADDTRVGGYPVAGRSPDIMVVHPDIDKPAPEAFKNFVARRATDTVNSTGTSVVYVRVHNRRKFEATAGVKVFAIPLDDANRPSSDPAAWKDFPPDPPILPGFPPEPAFAEVIVPPAGVGYARIEVPAASDPNPGGTNKAYLLLALIKSAFDDDDPLPAKTSVDSVDTFWELVSRYVDSDNAAARAVPWV